MCFSEQFYFLVSIVTLGQIITVYAMYMLYSSLAELPRYYPFDDFPMGLFLILGMLVICTVVQTLIFKTDQYLGIWGLKEGRKSSLRRKLPAINIFESDEDTGNHKFLDANSRNQRAIADADARDVFSDEMHLGPQDALVPVDFNRDIQDLYVGEIGSPHNLLDKVESLVDKTIRLNNTGTHQNKLPWSSNILAIMSKNEETSESQQITPGFMGVRAGASFDMTISDPILVEQYTKLDQHEWPEELHASNFG